MPLKILIGIYWNYNEGDTLILYVSCILCSCRIYELPWENSMYNKMFFFPWVVYSMLVEKCCFHSTIKIIIYPVFTVCPLLDLGILLELKEKAFLQV